MLAQFVDIHGVAKTKAVPVEHFEDIILEDGAGFAGFALWGMGQAPQDPDYMAIGDLATLTLVPWQPGLREDRVRWQGQGQAMAVRQPFRAEGTGPALERARLDIEFRDGAGIHAPRPRVRTVPLRPADETDRLDKPCYDYKGLARSRAFIERLVEFIEKAGFDVYQVDHEDANGQFEVNFTYADCLTTADRMVFFRMAAGEIARELGLICSFMPKPLSDRTGSGMHMHASMADAKNPNLFMDRSDRRKLGLSALAYQFLGGLLAHARALTALVAPTVNSYKRLVVGRSFSGATWAPAYISYGDNNRSCMVRIPYGRLEMRLIDSSANPYLATAGVIVAGLDGIDRKLDPGEPHNFNHYGLAKRTCVRVGSGPFRRACLRRSMRSRRIVSSTGCWERSLWRSSSDSSVWNGWTTTGMYQTGK